MAHTKVLVGVAVVAALGTGVAGAVLVTRDGGSEAPRTIVVAGSTTSVAGDASRNDAGTGAAPAIAPSQGFGKPQIEVRGTLRALDAPAQAWRYDKVELDAAKVAALAKAFGVTGLPRFEDGFWTVGAQQGLTLTARPDNGGVFDVYDQSGGTVASACTGGGTTTSGGPDGSGVSDAGSRSSGPTPSVSSATPPATTGPPPAGAAPCEQPQPPDGVPSAAAAEQRARSVWATAGIAVGQRTFVVEGSEWLRIVRAPLTLGGVKVGNDELTIGFGGGAAISFAHGVLGTPVKVALYPRIGTAKAIERWRSGEPTLPGGGWVANGTSATRIVGAGGTPAPTAGASSGAGATPGNPGPDDPVAPPATSVVPDKAPKTDGGPVTTGPDAQPMPLEPLNPTLIVTGVGEGLYGVTDVEGVEWLLPVYEFQLDRGGSTPVLAIDASWLQVAPVPAPQPLPAPAPGIKPEPSAKPGTEPAPAPGTAATAPAAQPQG